MSPKHQARALRRAAAACALGLCSAAAAAPGDLDCSFGGGSGRVTLDFGGDAESLLGLQVESDGRLLLSGLRVGSPSDSFAMARLLPGGAVDGSFGKRLSQLPGNAPAYIEAQALLASGKVLAAGTISHSSDDVYLARFKADGTPDLAFGNNGAVATDFGGDDYATAVAVQSDGKIVVAGGSIDTAGNLRLALARYGADGQLDTAFGSNGKRLVSVANWQDSEAWSLAVQADGAILVGGRVSTNDGTQHRGAFLLLRYTASGAADGSFGNAGAVITDVGAGADEIRALRVLGNGQIVAAGFSYDTASLSAADGDWALARYGGNGQLDSRFGSAGLAVKDWGGNWEEPAALLPLSDGSLLVAGFSNDEDAQFNVSGRSWIAHYGADGSVDTAFNSAASAVTDARYRALALQSDGQVVAGGQGSGNDDFLVSRLSLSAGPSTPCASGEPRDDVARGGGGGGAMGWMSLCGLLLAAAWRRRLRR